MPITDAVQPQPSFDLWADVEELLRYHFMQNAFEAGTIVAVVAALIGWFMVLRGQSFAGHTLSQVGFPGAAGAALVGVMPAVGLLVFCVLSAVGIAALGDERSEGRRAESAAIGSILAFTLATGFLFASLYSGFVGGVYAFLFGTFIGIGDSQVEILAAVAAIALVALALIGRPLLFASVEPDVAAARGVPVRTIGLAFLLLLGLGVAEAAQITGTLLVFALLVAPAATAQQLSARPRTSLLLSVVLAVGVTWLGLAVAYYSIYPIGFFITTFAFAAYLVARTVRWRLHGAARASVPA